MPSVVKHGTVTNDVDCNSLIRVDEYLVTAVLPSVKLYGTWVITLLGNQNTRWLRRMHTKFDNLLQ